MLACNMIGILASFCAGLFDSRIVNKAGPDWFWMGGRDDVIRSLYFRPNGSFRRYGLPALVLTLAAGSMALFWVLQRI
jgi:hypothetical protein